MQRLGRGVVARQLLGDLGAREHRSGQGARPALDGQAGCGAYPALTADHALVVGDRAGELVAIGEPS